MDSRISCYINSSMLEVVDEVYFDVSDYSYCLFVDKDVVYFSIRDFFAFDDIRIASFG